MKHMNPIATETNAPTEKSHGRRRSLSVFLVDDDASVRRALARLIKSAGPSRANLRIGARVSRNAWRCCEEAGLSRARRSHARI